MSTRSLTLTPIGVIRTPFDERIQAPRQPSAAAGARGTIRLEPGRGYEHALCDLDLWKQIWLLFWFDRNPGWRPKVLPPRSRRRRGVFATRSPHRPNPLGLSVVELERVDGLELHVKNVDLLDGTPILDIKPYHASDCVPDAPSGWLARAPDADPGPCYEVSFEDGAEQQLGYLAAELGVDLRSALSGVLALGPAPHPYRRIRKTPQGLRIAYKDWRASFAVEGQRVIVTRIESGYRARELASDDPALAGHRAFVARFG